MWICQIKRLQMSYLICSWIGQADSLGAIGWIEILVTLSELQICTVCLISWHWSPVLERLQVASREGHQDNFQICGSSRYRHHLHFQFQKQSLKLSNVNLKGASASASYYRLERWSNFVGNAIAMVFFSCPGRMFANCGRARFNGARMCKAMGRACAK